MTNGDNDSGQNDSIQFLEYQKPALEAGDYKIEIKQKITGDKIGEETFTSGETRFTVSGERFSLNPGAIHAMFPPSGGTGRYFDVLPHISIKRSTFPWERSAYGNEDYEPWLALLLFDEEEFIDKEPNIEREVHKQAITLARLKADSTQSGTPKFPEVVDKNGTPTLSGPSLGLETNQEPDKVNITVIDVKKSLLEKIIPTGDELKLLVHVRRRMNGDESSPETELAVVMGNRLPKKGSGSTACLVSVEGRYNDSKTFDFQGATGDERIRLVCLKSWSFTSEIRYKVTDRALKRIEESDKELYDGLKETLNTMLAVNQTFYDKYAFIQHLVDYGITVGDDNSELPGYFERRGFEEFIEAMSSSVLRMPEAANSEAEKFLSRGYALLPHKLRQCDTTYSWYRGPLATHPEPGKFSSDGDMPNFGDALIRYHKDIGMFDISYAAAFELGRALALEDKTFSAAIFQWKHRHNQGVCKKKQEQDTSIENLRASPLDEEASADTHEPEESTGSNEDPLKSKIKNFFNNLMELKGIPFNYLVPDEKMLPQESIRFFKIDEHWIECLLCGAFSIGGKMREESSQFCDHTPFLAFDEFRRASQFGNNNTMSGFIVRSALVRDYPDLLVDAYKNKIADSNPLTEGDKDSKCTNLRFARLGPDVLFCLYDGDVQMAELYLKPEGLHFGLDEEQADDGSGMKYEKDIEKKGPDGNTLNITVPLPNLVREGGKRVIKITTNKKDGIADRIADALELSSGMNSAQFGMHMLEGSNKGRFVIA